ERIDEVNAHVYETINNGVYKAGFATAQEGYGREVTQLLDALGGLEERLGPRRYLLGERLTEADWRLFTTLVRFDPVYHGHFKCNLRRIADYPNLSGYLRALYQWPGVAGTVDFDHIKQHYYRSHPTINPDRIVPDRPLQDLDAPAGRAHLPASWGRNPSPGRAARENVCTRRGPGVAATLRVPRWSTQWPRPLPC